MDGWYRYRQERLTFISLAVTRTRLRNPRRCHVVACSALCRAMRSSRDLPRSPPRLAMVTGITAITEISFLVVIVTIDWLSGCSDYATSTPYKEEDRKER